MDVNPALRTVRSPYPNEDGSDGEELLAVPAIRLDAAFVHLNRADAARQRPVPRTGPVLRRPATSGRANRAGGSSRCEKVVPTESLLDEGTFHTLRINRTMVDGVIEAPNGAHFTTCEPDYGRDEKFQKHYATSAADPAAWQAFVDRFLSGSEQDYQAAVGAWKQEQKEAAR